MVLLGAGSCPGRWLTCSLPAVLSSHCSLCSNNAIHDPLQQVYLSLLMEFANLGCSTWDGEETLTLLWLIFCCIAYCFLGASRCETNCFSVSWIDIVDHRCSMLDGLWMSHLFNQLHMASGERGLGAPAVVLVRRYSHCRMLFSWRYSLSQAFVGSSILS